MFAADASADPSFLEQIGPTLVAVVLTGIVGVVAAWVGRRWEQAAGHASWVRDRRQEAYAALLTAVTETWTKIADLNFIAGRHERRPEDADVGDEYDRKLDAVVAARATMSAAYAVVLVVGPDEIVGPAQALAVEVDEGIEKAHRAELQPGLQRGDKIRAFTAAARVVLGT